MTKDLRHKSLLQFVKRILDVPAGHAKEDLAVLRSVASREFPSVVRIIDEYMRLAERADTDIPSASLPAATKRQKTLLKDDSTKMHLFDLLREKQLFPSNNDLAEFAKRSLPNIKGHRFNKMSRGDIAARIIEYLESKEPRTREELEASMRDALAAPTIKPADRRSFFSKWERIIKGTA